jgi:hypothetical protein
MSEKETIDSLGFWQYNQAKSKTPQPKKLYEPQGRDAFQTPDYAVDLLLPFLPKREIYYIWEPAAGEGKISKRLLSKLKCSVWSTDIRCTEYVKETNLLNFIEKEKHPFYWIDRGKEPIIITNPPFSLKIDFYERCLEYDIPFALLIPADYAGWNINACQSLGCEKIIPTRRIDYITPSGKSGESGHTADFHSMWLTWGFGLGKTETFVELSLEDKKLNI